MTNNMILFEGLKTVTILFSSVFFSRYMNFTVKKRNRVISGKLKTVNLTMCLEY